MHPTLIILSYSTTEQHAPRQQRRHSSTSSTTFNNIRTYDVKIGGNPKGNAPGSATHGRLISVPQRQASRVNIPHVNVAMDHRLPTLRNPWNRTFSACDKCGFGHLNGTCPAYNKVCYQCNKFGHFAKQCTSKTKTKSSKKRSRDQERIQKFHNRVMLLKELPFRNIRNAAFLYCMNFNDALKTEISATKAKLQKNMELCDTISKQLKHEIATLQERNSELEQKAQRLQDQVSNSHIAEEKLQTPEERLLKSESEKLTLDQHARNLQCQLTDSAGTKNEVQALKNKVISLEKELETSKMCFDDMNKHLNSEIIKREKEKQQYVQQLAYEISEKLRFEHQIEIEKEYILELENKLHDMENTLQSIPPPQYQWNGVPQNSWSNGPVPTYQSVQQSYPFPCQPVDTNPQQPPPPPNRRRRGRRQHRGWFY